MSKPITCHRSLRKYCFTYLYVYPSVYTMCFPQIWNSHRILMTCVTLVILLTPIPADFSLDHSYKWAEGREKTIPSPSPPLCPSLLFSPSSPPAPPLWGPTDCSVTFCLCEVGSVHRANRSSEPLSLANFPGIAQTSLSFPVVPLWLLWYTGRQLH